MIKQAGGISDSEFTLLTYTGSAAGGPMPALTNNNITGTRCICSLLYRFTG
jgi:hypothetical protein